MTAFVLFNNSQVVGITTKSPFTGTPRLNDMFDANGVRIEYTSAENSRQLDSFEQAVETAETLSKLTGEQYIPVDDGQYTSHRFGVIVAPKVGDEVSRGFNGDYYFCGKIIKITPTFRVTTEDQYGNRKVFNRRKQSGSWVQVGGTWSMVKGVHEEMNPHF